MGTLGLQCWQPGIRCWSGVAISARSTYTAIAPAVISGFGNLGNHVRRGVY